MHFLLSFSVKQAVIFLDRILRENSSAYTNSNFIVKEQLIMARRGENIYKRKDGRWEGRYVRGCDCNGRTIFGYVYAKTYREVREKLTAAKNNAAKPVCSKKNFGTFCDEWLTLSRNRVKESTYAKYHSTVNLHIKPMLGEHPPQRFNTVMIEEFSNTLLKNGLSAKTVRDILVVLKSVLKYCRRQMGAAFPEIEVIYPKERKKNMRVLTIAEQQRLIEFLACDMDEAKFGVLLALLTGMRIGEICALKWCDININEGTIHVASTMQRLQVLDDSANARTKINVGDAKSTASERIIPMNGSIKALCEKMLVSDGEAYVLTGESARFLEPRTVQYRLAKYTAACGITGVHFHTLRHTFATRCVEVGFEIKSLSEILGHASAKVTLDRYVHSSLELKRANMDKLAAVDLNYKPSK